MKLPKPSPPIPLWAALSTVVVVVVVVVLFSIHFPFPRSDFTLRSVCLRGGVVMAEKGAICDSCDVLPALGTFHSSLGVSYRRGWGSAGMKKGERPLTARFAALSPL